MSRSWPPANAPWARTTPIPLTLRGNLAADHPVAGRTNEVRHLTAKPSMLRPGLRPGGVAPFGGSAADVLT